MQSRFEPLERRWRPSNVEGDGEEANIDLGGRHPLVEEAVEAVMQVGGAMMEMVEGPRGPPQSPNGGWWENRGPLKNWSGRYGRYCLFGDAGFLSFFFGCWVNRNPYVMVYEINPQRTG